MCKNTTPHQRSVGSCIFIAKIIKNRTIDEVISKSQGLNGVYPKIDVPPSFPLGLFHFGVCASQSASFALATTHSPDVLLNASRPTTQIGAVLYKIIRRSRGRQSALA